jgi:hypothetical protein
MPCSDGGWSDEVRVTRDDVAEHNMLEASMCGILTAFENKLGVDELNKVLDLVDWEEAGVKRRTLGLWWKKHKAKDVERRAREEAARRKEELKASGLSKLTPEEKVALGIK